MKTLDLHALLLGDPQRIRYITRYSTCMAFHKESVAEHSFFTCYIANLIGHWVEGNCHLKLDWRKLMTAGVLHDVDESLTGDFYRPFKYSDPQLLADLRRGAALAMEQVALQLTGTASDDTPFYETKGAYDLYCFWRDAKDDTPEGCILALADFLSVVSYISQEIAASNFLMREHVKTVREFRDEFDGPHFDFLRPLIEQVSGIIDLYIMDPRISEQGVANPCLNR